MKHIKIGITHGDINGNGYEAIMKVLSEQKNYDGKTFIVYGSPKAAAYHRKSLDLQNFNFNLINSADEAAPKRPNIINCIDEDIHVDAGMSTAEAGKAAIAALQKAVTDLKNGSIDVLITMPVNRENVRLAGFDFNSHTDFLAKEFGTTQHFELYANNTMKVCFVAKTSQAQEIAKEVTKDAILQRIVAFNDSLCVDFGERKPKIAVLALNSDVCNEEKTTIQQAIDEAKSSGFVVVGPYLAESFFVNGEYRKFAGVLGMYRTQVVVPFKTYAFDDSISYAAGLPKICVSPAMEVNYEAVDKNITEETPLLNAIFAACDLFAQREQYAELTQNQLK